MSVKTTPRPSWRNDLALALIAALVLVAVGACNGFRELTNAGGDNDSLLRLVEAIVQMLWPALLFCMAVFFTARAARSFASDRHGGDAVHSDGDLQLQGSSPAQSTRAIQGTWRLPPVGPGP